MHISPPEAVKLLDVGVDPSSAPMNVAELMFNHAAQRPTAIAFKIPQGSRGRITFESISFETFAQRVQQLARALKECGLAPGTKTLVLVSMGEAFVRSVYALFALGAVPVCIDPGMGRKQFLDCIERIAPEALLGTQKAVMLSRVPGIQAFKTIRIRHTVAANPTLLPDSVKSPVLHYAAAQALGAIVFTSGSTGAPKAVPYTRGQMRAQVAMLQSAYGFGPADTDLPLLNAFSLFNPALGSATIVPPINPRRPAASLNPRQLWATLRAAGATRSFGSPRLWSLIAHYAQAHNLSDPTMRQIHLAGAPVPKPLVEALMHIFPQATIHSPYGATEALPVSTLDGATRLALHADNNHKKTPYVCIGTLLAGMQAKIVPIKEGVMEAVHLYDELPANTLGEIVVKGATVSESYVGDPEATRRTKIRTLQGTWHRMGDLGFKDTQGRLWFCGRAAERVTNNKLYWDTEPAEAVLREHPQIKQAALIGFGPKGKQTPAIAVTLKKPVLWPHKRLELYYELDAWARAHPYTQDIDTFFIVRDMPVDIRHNAKIHRLALARSLERRWKGRFN
ncbi:MAG TPA: fatty acid CoA ligase family protein [Opitutales bacterium]|nr:fatty acid CoA ligase family protein [Opitutales bacterium]